MKKHVMWSVLALMALALAGCGRATNPVQSSGNGTPATGSDAAQVSTVLEANPDAVDEDVFNSSDAMSVDVALGAAAVRPLRFWRVITNVERNVNTEFGEPDSTGRPTLALVTVNRHLTGTFNLLAGSTDPADTTRSLVRKPLEDQWQRKLVMRRFAMPGDSGRGRWHLVGTSGVEVRTVNGATRLQSIRVQSDNLDTLITDPLALHRLGRVLFIAPGAQVTLTATTAAASDEVLFYGRDLRRRFVNNGDGTHTFTFQNGDFPGLRHFGVDALSRGTLFDDAAAYDSNAWIFPFVADPRRAPMAR